MDRYYKCLYRLKKKQERYYLVINANTFSSLEEDRRVLQIWVPTDICKPQWMICLVGADFHSVVLGILSKTDEQRSTVRLTTNVTMMIPNIMPIYSKYLDREKTNINCHANWPCNLTMTPRTWTNLQLVGWKKEEDSSSSNGPAKAQPNWNVSYKQMPTNLDEQHH